jgi:hypothetical protein
MRLVVAVVLVCAVPPAAACPDDPEQIELAILARQIRSLHATGGRYHRSVEPPPPELLMRVQALQRRRVEPAAPLPGGLVDGASFAALKARVSGSRLSAPMMRVVDEEAPRHWLCVAHVRELLSLFSHEEDRITALARLAQRVVDGENASLLDSLFVQAERRERSRAFFAR